MTGDRTGSPRYVAVLDVGKTNVKAVLHDLVTGTDLDLRTTPNAVRQDGPYPHFDAAPIQAFFTQALADFVRCGPAPLDAISVTTHGAAGALLGRNGQGRSGLALPILDYEHEGPKATAEAYDRIRPDFTETYSPRLPGGLNLGAQLFWQAQAFPDAFARVEAILTYPQYWSWWLTGVRACEPTSLGAHTDLWNPHLRQLSSLVGRAGLEGRFAPIRSAFDRLGFLRRDIAARVGIDHPVPVMCGIHDSNAALLPHMMERSTPLSVVSTGTWVIIFALGGSLDGLDPHRDTLANVDVLRRPVPSARFMGGREFDLIAGPQRAVPDAATVGRVVERGIMVLPTLVPGNGPFPRSRGRWSHAPESLDAGERVAVASLYAGLMTAACLEVLGAQGPTAVEGPFARNELYVDAVMARTGRSVLHSNTSTGSSGGAARLALMGGEPAHRTEPGRPTAVPHVQHHDLGQAFGRYAETWCSEASAAEA